MLKGKDYIFFRDFFFFFNFTNCLVGRTLELIAAPPEGLYLVLYLDMI